MIILDVRDMSHRRIRLKVLAIKISMEQIVSGRRYVRKAMSQFDYWVLSHVIYPEYDGELYEPIVIWKS